MTRDGGIWRYQGDFKLRWTQPSYLSGIDASRPNNGLTIVTDNGRRSGRQILFGNCTFNIESIPICDGGTLIRVTKVALDYIEVAVN